MLKTMLSDVPVSREAFAFSCILDYNDRKVTYVIVRDTTEYPITSALFDADVESMLPMWA